MYGYRIVLNNAATTNSTTNIHQHIPSPHESVKLITFTYLYPKVRDWSHSNKPSWPVFLGLRVLRAGKGVGWARLLSHLFRNRRGVRRGVKSLGRTARSWAA